MAGQYDISVVISTYNRSGMLRVALERLLEQQAEGVRYEVIVVDNNSTDRTREVVESFVSDGHADLRYVFEPKQGISYGRNTGIANSSAEIIAFTDDDVRVGRDWVIKMKRAFDAHPEVDFVGGPILPEWKSEPPEWLTRDHWWPLALLDFGDKPFYVNIDIPVCLPTANISFRRRAFDHIGLFSPEFSGREDHELLVRLWRTDRQGIYIPDIAVTAEVQPERLKKDYHRKWNLTTGKFNSLMRLNESVSRDGRFVGELPDQATLFGVPGFVYRKLLTESLRWVAAAARWQSGKSQQHKNHIWYLIGYISKRIEKDSAERKHSSLTEIGAFTKTLLRKKLYRN
ncbi:MAG TPA: glycosyltransferase [Blastocatellia bacterium]|nr:glycosyltransferase [Blastocatellia bacterium]